MNKFEYNRHAFPKFFTLKRMDLPVYDGNIHPNEWLKRVRACCFLKHIVKDEEILKFAKMVIDSTINIPENVTSLDELVNALKRNIAFSTFKNINKIRLLSLKFSSPNRENVETLKFIDDFCRLCRDADIDDLQEQKKYLYLSIPNEYFEDESYKKLESTNSTSELIEAFGKMVIEESNLIRDDSIIVLKHVATGKYLSSIGNLSYVTGSCSQSVCLSSDSTLFHYTIYNV